MGELTNTGDRTITVAAIPPQTVRHLQSVDVRMGRNQPIKPAGTLEDTVAFRPFELDPGEMRMIGWTYRFRADCEYPVVAASLVRGSRSA